MSDYLECGHPRGCQGAIYDAEAAQPGTDDLPVRLGCKACERGGWVYVSEGLPPVVADRNDAPFLVLWCNGLVRPAWRDFVEEHWTDWSGYEILENVAAWMYWPDPSPLPETEEGEG